MLFLLMLGFMSQNLTAILWNANWIAFQDILFTLRIKVTFKTVFYWNFINWYNLIWFHVRKAKSHVGSPYKDHPDDRANVHPEFHSWLGSWATSRLSWVSSFFGQTRLPCHHPGRVIRKVLEFNLTFCIGLLFVGLLEKNFKSWSN